MANTKLQNLPAHDRIGRGTFNEDKLGANSTTLISPSVANPNLGLQTPVCCHVELETLPEILPSVSQCPSSSITGRAYSPSHYKYDCYRTLRTIPSSVSYYYCKSATWSQQLHTSFEWPRSSGQQSLYRLLSYLSSEGSFQPCLFEETYSRGQLHLCYYTTELCYQDCLTNLNVLTQHEHIDLLAQFRRSQANKFTKLLFIKCFCLMKSIPYRMQQNPKSDCYMLFYLHLGDDILSSSSFCKGRANLNHSSETALLSFSEK